MTESIDEDTSFGFSNNGNSQANSMNRSVSQASNYRQGNNGADSQNTRSNFRSNFSNPGSWNPNGGNGTGGTGGTSSNWANRDKKDIVCYCCGEKGHFATTCPKKGNGGNGFKGANGGKGGNGFKSGQFNKNQNYKQQKSNTEVENNQSQKVCQACGVQGRHPRGSECPTVVKKRKQKEDKNE